MALTKKQIEEIKQNYHTMDLFEIFGVSNKLSIEEIQEEIAKSYKENSLIFNPNATDATQEEQELYKNICEKMRKLSHIAQYEKILKIYILLAKICEINGTEFKRKIINKMDDIKFLAQCHCGIKDELKYYTLQKPGIFKIMSYKIFYQGLRLQSNIEDTVSSMIDHPKFIAKRLKWIDASFVQEKHITPSMLLSDVFEDIDHNFLQKENYDPAFIFLYTVFYYVSVAPYIILIIAIFVLFVIVTETFCGRTGSYILHDSVSFLPDIDIKILNIPQAITYFIARFLGIATYINTDKIQAEEGSGLLYEMTKDGKKKYIVTPSGDFLFVSGNAQNTDNIPKDIKRMYSTREYNLYVVEKSKPHLVSLLDASCQEKNLNSFLENVIQEKMLHYRVSKYDPFSDKIEHTSFGIPTLKYHKGQVDKELLSNVKLAITEAMLPEPTLAQKEQEQSIEHTQDCRKNFGKMSLESLSPINTQQYPQKGH